MWDEKFGLVGLTALFNGDKVGYVPGQVGAMGLFEEDGIAETVIRVEHADGKLQIIEPTERGGPGVAVSKSDSRGLVTFSVDHYEVNDVIRAEEVQGVRLLGSDDELETVENRIASRLKVHARNFDATLEYQRLGALKGVILSGRGKVLHNLYTSFGIATPAATSLGLGSQNAKIADHIKSEVVYRAEDKLDAAHDGIHAFAGRDFMAALWGQEAIRETYIAENAGAKLRGGCPDVLTVGEVTFERYRTGRRAKAALGSAFVADNQAVVAPKGVPDLFITRFAPADLEEAVNTIGLPRYAHQYPQASGKGRHLDMQMNAISICTQPGALQTLEI